MVDAHVRSTLHVDAESRPVSRNGVAAQVHIDFVGDDGDGGARTGQILGDDVGPRRRDRVRATADLSGRLRLIGEYQPQRH